MKGSEGPPAATVAERTEEKEEKCFEDHGLVNEVPLSCYLQNGPAAMISLLNSLMLVQAGGHTGLDINLQVMGSNPGNFAPNPMQIQPQMGIISPQTPIPFTNPGAHFAPNQFLPNYPIVMNLMNNMNNPLPMPQIFGQNLNLGFPNQIQPDINRILQLQISNFNSQAVPGNLGLAQNPAFFANTQPSSLNLPQNLAFVACTQPDSLSLPQSLAFAANTHLGFVGSSGIVQQGVISNASNGTPNATQQLQGSSSLGQGLGPISPSQNQKNFNPQPSKFKGSHENGMGTHVIRNNGKRPQYKNFKRNPKHESPRNGFMKPKFNKMQNSSGNFNSRNMQLTRRNDNGGERQISVVNSVIQTQVDKKRSISLSYTEKEIQEWREERRKNYPSKANIDKKLREKLTKPEVSDKVAKLRRQQLKEILAKQAELGCEVAEIPSSYLSDSEQQMHERKSRRTFSKTGNFQNKFNKNGTFNQNNRFSHKKGVTDHDSSNAYSHNDHMAKKQRLMNDNLVSQHAISKREPTLLQKLLSADIRRDKHHILQVFRFMVTNSFFKDWPTKPLKFPVVMVKETVDEDDLSDGNLVDKRKDGTEGISGEIEELICDDNDDQNHNGMEKPERLLHEETGPRGVPVEEEEGEIIN
ncbi:hypothetical protein ACH5RR_023224 [Cinchona calisaya]|uniref:FMR1-interacting protein 1 conserved domain-containing protein n=1 Tax=Cinchona calisaya TaxID=153742 RepID=A0ABD2ZD71_9GENT